jgi:cytochrome c peroxidase
MNLMKQRLTGLCPLLLLVPACLDSSLDESSAEQASNLTEDFTADSIGMSETVSPNRIDLSSRNPFFHDFGTNGRTCGTCHAEAFGWTITPEFAQARPANDPLFVFDGSDCLPPGVANPNPAANSRQMLSRANVRIDIGIPPGADFTLVSYNDPLGCPTPPSATDLRMYRRPLPASNSAFLTTVMWDGREMVNPPNNTIALIQADLKHQANDATLGHAQATSPLSAANQNAIMTFETGLFNAQSMIGTLNLNAAGAKGGGDYLYKTVLPQFNIGVNDVLGCAIPNSCAPGVAPTFTSRIFTVYANWEPDAVPPPPPGSQAAAIGRGEQIFNTRTFSIDDVGGLNRSPGDPVGAGVVFTGSCGTCHDTPEIGNHSTALPIDIGIAEPAPAGGLDVSGLPTYTFRETATGITRTVTDPARALITGKFKDLGKTKGPNLRALATRAPYFHNGSARDLGAAVDFYQARFHFTLTAQEKSDLVAFLNAL